MIVKDMMQRSIEVPYPPQRIVSLVPSQTELLYDLGLEAQVGGITKFCIHPQAWKESKTIVGGTKTLHFDRIRALQPDLIIANKEENTQAEIEALAREFPLWISDISTLSDALEMIRGIGLICAKESTANSLANNIELGFQQLNRASQQKRVAYFIWREPWMSIGQDTFIHDMIDRLGWENVYAHTQRYPETSLEELPHLNPDYVLLSSEPYPFKDKHIAEIQQLLPLAKILLVDGEMFSWYGSRMLKAVDYFKSLQDSL